MWERLGIFEPGAPRPAAVPGRPEAPGSGPGGGGIRLLGHSPTRAEAPGRCLRLSLGSPPAPPLRGPSGRDLPRGSGLGDRVLPTGHSGKMDSRSQPGPAPSQFPGASVGLPAVPRLYPREGSGVLSGSPAARSHRQRRTQRNGGPAARLPSQPAGRWASEDAGTGGAGSQAGAGPAAAEPPLEEPALCDTVGFGLLYFFFCSLHF